MKQKVMMSIRSQTEVLGLKKQKDDFHLLKHHTFLPNNHYLISLPLDHPAIPQLKNSNSFVINYLDLQNNYVYNYLGSNNIENNIENLKINEKIIDLEESITIDCPKIKNSKNVECEIINNISQKDHIIFIAKILNKNWR